MFLGGIPVFIAAVAATKQTVKADLGRLHALKLLNTTAAKAYLQCFNKLAADVTVGVTVPDFVIPLAANEGTTIPLVLPIGFSIGLVIAGCTTATGNTGAAIDVLAVIE